MKELGLRWRPLGYGALLVAALTGVELAAPRLERGPLAVPDRALGEGRRSRSRLIVASYLHNFVFGPRLQAEIREGRPQTTRPTLVVVGWTSLDADDHRADPRRGPREPRELARASGS